MPDYRRYYVPNAVVFITTVVAERRPLFADKDTAILLITTMRVVQTIYASDLLAYVILPDHVHLLLRTEPPVTFSQVMQSIKWNFTRSYKKTRGIGGPVTVWQQRFWDHIIRDEGDLARHLDYVHYNPIKHGLTTLPSQWNDSTFLEWMQRGYYEQTWGVAEPQTISGMSME